MVILRELRELKYGVQALRVKNGCECGVKVMWLVNTSDSHAVSFLPIKLIGIMLIKLRARIL